MRRFSFFRALHAIMPLVIYYVVSQGIPEVYTYFSNKDEYMALGVEHIDVPIWMLIISYSLVAVILFFCSYKLKRQGQFQTRFF